LYSKLKTKTVKSQDLAGRFVVSKLTYSAVIGVYKHWPRNESERLRARRRHTLFFRAAFWKRDRRALGGIDAPEVDGP